MGSENIRFFYINQWDSQTIAASTENASYPATNTQIRSPAKAFRTTDINAETLRTSGSSSLTVSCFCLFNHNFTSAATVKVQGSNDNWVSTPLDTAMTKGSGDFTNQYVYYPDVPTTYDDWGIYVDDPTNTDGYLKMGRIWMAVYTEPEHGFNDESIPIDIDPSILNLSDGNQGYVVKRPKQYGWNLIFPLWGSRQSFRDIFNTVGYTDQMMVLKKPYDGLSYTAKENNTFLVRIQQSSFAGLSLDDWGLAITLIEDM